MTLFIDQNIIRFNIPILSPKTLISSSNSLEGKVREREEEEIVGFYL